MPNFKIFQDSPDQARIKIYGADNTGAAQPLLTSTSGVISTSGVVGVSGNVGVSGSVTAGISGAVGISGSVAVSGNVGVSGSVTAGISGAVGISGSVAVSGNVGVSGSVTAGISGAVGISGTVALSGHSVVDSGPLSADVTPSTSGAVSGTFDVLSYSSWVLAVEYSGASGDGVHVVLQKSAVSGGVASGGDYITDSSGTFVSGNWLFLTTGVTPRYARLYYINSGTGSGTLYQTFQAQN